jgi:hypothetical protein
VALLGWVETAAKAAKAAAATSFSAVAPAVQAALVVKVLYPLQTGVTVETVAAAVTVASGPVVVLAELAVMVAPLELPTVGILEMVASVVLLRVMVATGTAYTVEVDPDLAAQYSLEKQGRC